MVRGTGNTGPTLPLWSLCPSGGAMIISATGTVTQNIKSMFKLIREHMS